jgi:type I restriction enzyme S subunit
MEDLRCALRRFKPHPAYKASGVEWLGEIPVTWVTIPLKRIASIRYGLGEPPEQLANGLPFIRATNVSKGRIIAHEMQFVDPKDVPWDRDPVLRSDDIIVVRSGAYTGDSAIIPPEYDCAIAGYDMVVRPRRGSVPQFIAWALLSGYVLDAQIKLESLRAAQPHLNAEELGAVVLLLPPDNEQRAITAFLDQETARIDALAAKKERLIALLQEKRTALVTRAVTKGLDPNVQTKDSGVEWLGEIPAHWNCPALARVTLCRCDGPFGSGLKSEHYSSEGVRVIRLQNLGWAEFLDSDQAYIDEVYASGLGDHSVVSEDLLIAGLGDEGHPVGRACTAPGDIEPAIVKADCFRFRLDRRRLIPRFAAYQLSATASATAASLSTGATRSRLNLTTMAARKVAVPPIDEQCAIVEFLDRNRAEYQALLGRIREAIDCLKELRSALIAAAVTGKIDVRKEIV